MDPFVLLRREVQENMSLLHAHLETLSTITPDSHKWSNTLSEASRLHRRCNEDAEAMAKAIQVMATHSERFQLSADELDYRRQLWKGLSKTLLDMQGTIDHYEHMTSQHPGTRKNLTSTDPEKSTRRTQFLGATPYPPSRSGDSKTTSDDTDHQDTNEFLRYEMQKQRKLNEDQEAQMEDMVQGVRRARILASDINTNLEEDEVALNNLETETNTVTARIARTNAQIDRALRESSLKSKFICLGILLFVLIILLVLVFTV